MSACGARRPWSQGDGLGDDVTVALEQPAPGHDVDSGTEQGSELVDEVDLVEERSSGFEFDEEVHVAGGGGVAASDGAEDPDRVYAPTASNLEEFVAAFAEGVEGDRHGIYCRRPGTRMDSRARPSGSRGALRSVRSQWTPDEEAEPQVRA
jgi:hypothetical protein